MSAKAVALVATACVATGLCMMVVAHLALTSHAEEDFLVDVASAGRRAEDQLLKLGSRMASYAAIYASHPEVVATVAGGDRAQMQEVATRLYKQTLARDAIVSTFELTDRRGTVVMRGHKPESFGDSKAAEPLVSRALEGHAAQGLTVSATSGEVSTDAVQPILSRGERVGTLKIGSRFRAETAADVKHVTGSEVVFAFAGKVNASTLPALKTLPAAVTRPSAVPEPMTIEVAGVPYQMAMQHIPVIGAEPLTVLTLVDRRPELERLGSFELSLLGKTLLVIMLIIPCVVLIVRRGVRTIEDLTGAMRGLAQGQLDGAIPHRDRRDEIGAMANAVAVFQENAVRMRTLEAQDRLSGEERAARADAMVAVVAEVGRVVSLAARGDFSGRIPESGVMAELEQLVGGMNEINRVVDVATSEFAAVLEGVAQGDLTRTVSGDYRGRLGELKQAINGTIERLGDTVSTIQATATQIGLSSREIEMGASDLSLRTEQQAASLEETAATTEELAASVKHGAMSSARSAELARQAKTTAEEGGAIVGEAVSAMARIEQSSGRISEITSVIDEIAFQTNLLALNAAVEAARAGDAGKGFAVVASEVRTLAQRSGEAARDIKNLIHASGQEVAQGVELVQSAGAVLQKIVAAATGLSGNIDSIATASGEQASGIEEMAQTVAHLDEMTQQNAALSEQSAASAGTLSQQIQRLNQVVASFRTRTGGTPQRAATPAMARAA
ncbi:methyl-accepting chemotaxis protein [Bosea sp. Leaf344]|uniref:methyl-accepting chemotaxis protein n=1 Tax=Bosea sp. Leaf344 TaxID=1736346 RepID=UPI00138EE2AF|nr:methyl-accepting chemotaxis protein [Bosea sp. Leaf344]